MCPSYMVTREEKHSTRGRAHLLFEMLAGRRRSTDGWKSEAVKEALDLCLACKGCKGECPVNVDMAPTRPSSSRTTTRGGCGRGTPTRSGYRLVGAARLDARGW